MMRISQSKVPISHLRSSYTDISIQKLLHTYKLDFHRITSSTFGLSLYFGTLPVLQNRYL